MTFVRESSSGNRIAVSDDGHPMTAMGWWKVSVMCIAPVFTARRRPGDYQELHAISAAYYGVKILSRLEEKRAFQSTIASRNATSGWLL
jgi:hypothetical protein